MSKKQYTVLIQKDIPGFRTVEIGEIVSFAEQDALPLIEDGTLAEATDTVQSEPTEAIEED